MNASTIRSLIVFCLACVVLTATGCKSTASKAGGQAQAQDGFQTVEDLYVVDCLLPGQVRRLGNMNYLSARRPVRTTAVDCRIRGGEYVEYDRADYRSALNVWLPQAEQGDPEAQNYVGEIFEKGLGQQPDYVSARQWYQRAAEQGYSRAQINLGYMYEQGLGGEADMTVALNWYRKASGVKDDELMLSSEAKKQLDETRRQLTGQLKSAQVQTDYLQAQIADLRKEVEVQTELANQAQVEPEKLREAEEKITALMSLYHQARDQRDALTAQLDNMEVAYRNINTDELLRPEDMVRGEHRIYNDINFGRYFALIIGNQDYLFLDDLRSPVHDGERLQKVLEEKYGFSTLMLPNATEKNILNTVNEFYSQIEEQDNLLIYYAGHGNISRSEASRTERGYWLPVDAGQDNITNWINNSVISDHLDRIKARSVLVIADSCYAGYLGSAKSPFLFGVSSGAESAAAIRAGLSRRARVVISSGGIRPVPDGSDKNHSVFASALIEVLNQNDGAMRDSALFAQLSVNVRKRSEQTEAIQTPEMKPVREAGHEGGTFYFVPAGQKRTVGL